MPKITLIGAGSTVFAKVILGDILLFPELADSTLSLHDIDAERLRTTEKVARRIDDTEISRKGVPEYKKLKSTTPEKIAQAVKKVMKVSDEEMIAKTKGNRARKLYLYLLKKHTILKVVEIAELSQMSPVAAGELIRRFGREIKESKELATLLNHSEKLLNE